MAVCSSRRPACRGSFGTQHGRLQRFLWALSAIGPRRQRRDSWQHGSGCRSRDRWRSDASTLRASSSRGVEDVMWSGEHVSQPRIPMARYISLSGSMLQCLYGWRHCMMLNFEEVLDQSYQCLCNKQVTWMCQACHRNTYKPTAPACQGQGSGLIVPHETHCSRVGLGHCTERCPLLVLSLFILRPRACQM